LRLLFYELSASEKIEPETRKTVANRMLPDDDKAVAQTCCRRAK
jgi:hypothetical protein